MGLNEMVIPGEDSATKQKREIQILLSSPPITFPPQPQRVMGPNGVPVIQMIAAPPQPTVPIDETFDDHDVEFGECQDYANSDQGQSARKENPKGFANFTLHAKMHLQIIQQKQQAAAQQEMLLKHGPPEPPKPNLPKPPALSMKVEDLPPDAAAQALAQDNIQVSPEDLQAKQDQDREDKAQELQAKLAATSGAGTAGGWS